MKTKDKLKQLIPCPFCGKKNFYVTDKNVFYKLQKEYGNAAIEIRCNNCSLDLWEHTSDERNYDKRLEIAIAKWNTRKGEEI